MYYFTDTSSYGSSDVAYKMTGAETPNTYLMANLLTVEENLCD